MSLGTVLEADIPDEGIEGIKDRTHCTHSFINLIISGSSM